MYADNNLRSAGWVAVLALCVLAASGCSADDPPRSQPDRGLDGRFSWDLWPQSDWWMAADHTPTGETAVDGPATTTASVITPVEVQGSCCKNGWQDTGSTISGAACQVHLGSLTLRVGAVAEPDRYGCKLDAAGTGRRAFLYKLGCDDKSVQLDCGYLCFN